MYNDKVMERFQNPKFVGEIENADGVGEVGNVVCGDIMKVFIKIENNIIVDARFKTYGCVAAIASSDFLCDIVRGKTVEEAEKITCQDVVKEMGDIPEVKVHCSVLAKEALKKAIKEWKATNSKNTWKEK